MFQRGLPFAVLVLAPLLAAGCGDPSPKSSSAVPTVGVVATLTAASPTVRPLPSETPDISLASPTVAPAPTDEPVASPTKVDVSTLPRLPTFTTIDAGGIFFLEPFVLTLPAGRPFRVLVGVSDPGGERVYFLHDVMTDSELGLNATLGTVSGTNIQDPAVKPVFDAIVASLVVVAQ